MATLNIFAFGTGQKSTMKKKNIIAQFSEHCVGDRIVIDGPDLLGKEVAKNTKNITRTILKWLKDQDETSHNINFTGYSRGAITCIQIANRLNQYELFLERHITSLSEDNKKLLRQLKLINANIFALDPVAGMGEKLALNSRIIPANVKNYVALLQTDEMRRDFKPQDISRIIVASTKNTRVLLLPMYGNHSSSTRIKNEKMRSVPTIAWYALHQFLSKNGTTFKSHLIPAITTSDRHYFNLPPNPSNKDLLQLFTLSHQERPRFLSAGKSFFGSRGIPIARKMRSLNKHLAFYVKNSDVFTNQLERDLFKVSYPKVFNYLFERNLFDLRFPEDSASNRESVIAELALLRSENPELFDRLKPLGVTLLPGAMITLGEPSGVYCLEACSSINQIFRDQTHPLIRARADIIDRLSNLEEDIYRLTFRYEREKSDFMPFHSRAQSERMTSLRDAVKKIINDTPGDDRHAKFEQVLDCIEENYTHLIRSSSSSDLAQMLQQFLEEHGRHYQTNPSTLPEVLMAKFVYYSLSLLKETLNFIGNLGYLGGAVLSVIGIVLEDFGRRLNDILGALGHNPFKYVLSALAYTFEGLGFAIKNSFGLKPLTHFITSCIRNIRDAAVIAIGPIHIERFDTDQVNQTESNIEQSRSIK